MTKIKNILYLGRIKAEVQEEEKIPHYAIYVNGLALVRLNFSEEYFTKSWLPYNFQCPTF